MKTITLLFLALLSGCAISPEDKAFMQAAFLARMSAPRYVQDYSRPAALNMPSANQELANLAFTSYLLNHQGNK